MSFINLIQFTPDSPGYVGYADIIIKSSKWLHQVGLTSIDLTLYRMPLYPLLISLCKLLFGKNWTDALISLQLFSLLISAFFVYQLCYGLKFNKVSRWIALIGYITGLPLLFSFYVLTDGFYISFGISIFCNLCLSIINREKIFKYEISIFISVLLMSFLRETTLYFMATLLPLMVIPFFYKQYKHGIVTLIICFLPVIGAQECLKQWNKYRCGARILTTGTATALLGPQLELINQEPKALEYCALKNYLPTHRPLEFKDCTAAAIRLMKTQNKNILELQKIVEHDYFNFFKVFPRQQIHLILNRVSRDVLLVNFNPLYTFAQIFDPSDTQLPRLSKIRDCFSNAINLGNLLYILAVNVCRLFSLLLCLFGFYKFAQRIFYKEFNQQTFLLTAMLLHAFGWILIYSFVHVEIRYIATCVVMFLLVGCSPSFKDEQKLIKS